jgi:transformer-2 protein
MMVGLLGKTVWVGNMSRATKESDIEELFGKVGEIERVSMVLDRITKDFRGFAFVTFKSKESASQAIEELHDKELRGSRMVVQLSIRNKPRTKTPGKYLGQAKQPSSYRGDRYIN